MKLKNWHLLQMMADYYKVKIDPQEPRDSRLTVALECDRHQKIPEAIEAMTGIPVNEHDPAQLIAFSINRKSTSPQEFYQGFPSVDE